MCSLSYYRMCSLSYYREATKEQLEGFQYYSPSIHRASFILPEFARRKLDISLPTLRFQ